MLGYAEHHNGENNAATSGKDLIKNMSECSHKSSMKRQELPAH
ncbi:hypothetical protein HMPREF1608_05146 [Escherichia coli 908525]|nr:hypothetical protein HMPREF1608_05146 [Escherichia coli 908525]